MCVAQLPGALGLRKSLDTEPMGPAALLPSSCIVLKAVPAYPCPLSCWQADEDRSDIALDRREDMFKLLLPHPRINCYALDSDGCTALVCAVRWAHGNVENRFLLRHLLQLAQQHGMDINHQASTVLCSSPAVLPCWAGRMQYTLVACTAPASRFAAA